MRHLGLLACSLAVSACWRDARPVQSVRPVSGTVVELPARPQKSYRPLVLTADAVGVAAMGVGLAGIEGGWDKEGVVFSGGLLLSAFAAPVISLAYRNLHNAGGSYLTRMITVSVGMVVGAAASCRDHELLCGLDGLAFGAAAGLAVANVFDVVYFSTEHAAPAWQPYVTPTDGGARAGFVKAF